MLIHLTRTLNLIALVVVLTLPPPFSLEDLVYRRTGFIGRPPSTY